MTWDWGDFALAIAALFGLVAVVVQFGFDMADHGSPVGPEESRSEELRSRIYRKAA